MSTIVTRAGKGSPLTNNEMDANLTNLNTDKIEVAYIHSATSKTTPVDADEIPLVDSEASNSLKKLTWANIKSALKSYFDALYWSVTQQPTMRNKIINGDMRIDQRNGGSAQTITAGAALAFTVDRFYAYCTGANVTGQRVSGTAPNQYNYRFTGAASATKIGFAQRIESANCQDLAGSTATLSVDLANSLLTIVTWTAWYANTADTFGSLASPTRTQIATGTLTVSSTLGRYSAQISIPAAATTGIEIEFSVGAQTSGTWTIGRVQLESGSVATPFEVRQIGTELLLCQRYFEVLPDYIFALVASASVGNKYNFWTFKAKKRVTPTMANTGVAYAVISPSTDFCRVSSSAADEPVLPIGATASSEL